MFLIRGITYAVMLLCATACVSTYDNSAPKVNKFKASDTHVELGMSYLRNGDRVRSLSAFSRALEINSKSAEALHGMALIHQLNAEYVLSEKSFLRALKVYTAKSKTPIHLSYARFLFERERYAESMKYFEMVSRDISYPGRSNALYMLGLAALNTGNEPRALASFEHALNLNQKNTAAALELADIKLSKKEYPHAKKYLDQYASNAKHTARSLLIGIKIERVFGNKDKEASYAIALKNMYPYSKEYLEYKKAL